MAPVVLDLSIELQRLVLHGLPLDDLLSCRASCIGWRTVADEPTYWRQLARDVWGVQIASGTIKAYVNAAIEAIEKWDGTWIDCPRSAWTESQMPKRSDSVFIVCKLNGEVTVKKRARPGGYPLVVHAHGSIVNGNLVRLTYAEGDMTEGHKRQLGLLAEHFPKALRWLPKGENDIMTRLKLDGWSTCDV